MHLIYYNYFTLLFYVAEEQGFRSLGFYSCFSLESIASNTEGEEEKEEETALCTI